MMRSMYSGISGLKNHQARMDVIGNNIANVNTAGYKKSRVVFKDTLYQNIRGASRPTDARGGTNPMGVGLGMTISSIDQIHTPSPTTITNKTTDMAVDGNGYFLVSNGGQVFYTRAGAFDFDEMGNLVNTSNGYRVQGWLADRSEEDWAINTVSVPTNIDISGFKTVSPRATENTVFSGNLNSETEIPESVATDPTTGFPGTDDEDKIVITSKEVYDSLGNSHTVYFRFFKTAVTPSATPGDTTSTWACDISLDAQFNNVDNFDSTNDFDKAVLGQDPSYTKANPKLIRATDLIFNEQGEITDKENAWINLVINSSAAGAENTKIKIDFKDLTQFNTKSNAKAEYQDGYTMGNLTSFSVGTDGSIQGAYDNGEVRNLARVALANFQNPAGLIQTGNSLYQVSNNSGDALVGAPGDQGMGAVIPGSLEMSNVDLSEEFTDMIVTQRGFQANSRIITTSDEMLQELVNLKR
ncbi:MAG: flagellar hook protein FlgE [Syntrophomonadaceae bacterium]|nr:flagellar hook protein FlgE [Syntrophomonadaceae bacterium]MDD3890042.1 flagellar hook protein FlgE [Syntrophomonadaceae bacterium]MDD4548231.1 flagellar hook protein FlgE [Syntrophomonadaceae bacterium]